jgi:hypothetical protein
MSTYVGKGGAEYEGLSDGTHVIRVADDVYGDMDLAARLAHELVHAAVASGDKADTGISCASGEAFQACTERWTGIIRSELESENHTREEKEHQR